METDTSALRATRPYRQRERAATSARTRAQILDSTVALVLEGTSATFSLNDIADGARVSVQTVLRHFGSREGVLDAALEYGAAAIAAERDAPAGDVCGAIATLLDHYERRGDGVMRLLAREPFDARIAQVTTRGREVHRRWVAGLLPQGSPLRHSDVVIDALVVVTDVYTWKLLRRDRGLSRG